MKEEYLSKSREADQLSREASDSRRETTEYNSETKRYETKTTTDEYKSRRAADKRSEADAIRARNRPVEIQLEQQIAAEQWKIRQEQVRYQAQVARTLAQYEALAARPEIKAALRELNRGARPKLAMGPAAAYEQNVFRQSVDTMAVLGYRRENDQYWLLADADFVKECDKVHLTWREVAMHERRLAPAGQPAPAVSKRASVPARPGTSPAALMTAAQVAARRADLVRGVRELRRQADSLQARRDALLAEGEARDCLEEINKASTKRRQAKIGTRPGFAKALQNLEAMERAIRAEKIALRRDGEHLRADVRLDGKPSSMVVDPSAEWIKLPDRLAAELGVRPAPNAPTVSLPSGNGQSTNARRATIGTLQIGSYAAEGVECLVLPPGADPGPPVLGGLALQRALVELDGVEATLTLTRVDPPPSATTAPATAKATPRPPTR